MLAATFAAALAIVVQDGTALRAAPRRGAQAVAQLAAGETLELRGERLDYVQVYDHRLERGGYVPGSQIRAIAVTPEAAPELLAVVRFLRDTPGSEALGIGYVAAYLKAAPAQAIDAEAFAALGAMADRLAQRASRGSGADPRLAAQLDIARGYGVVFESFEREGRMQVCYDGDALQRVFTLRSTAEQRAQAALALTRHECLDPATPPLDANALNAWRAKLLDKVDVADLSPLLRNRIHIRRAGVWAGLAFAQTRQGEPGQEAGQRAVQELADVKPGDLTDDERIAYADAAVRVGASRWAAEDEATPLGALRIATQRGGTGETCVLLLDGAHDAKAPLARRCTYGTVWAASASSNRAGTALALAVQPLAGWRELWVFRKGAKGWGMDVLPPAAAEPGIGYAEFAGWVPGKPQLLVAREARAGGRFTRSFEVVNLDTLNVVRRADDPSHLTAFYRWQSPAWRQLTVSLR